MRIWTEKLSVLAMLGYMASAVAGCGSSSLGLPSDKPLSSLSKADLQTACRNLVPKFGFSDVALHGVCAASLLNNGQQACMDNLEACFTQTKSMLAQSTDPAQCDDPSKFASAEFTSCSATVGEFDACYSSIHDGFETYYSAVSCSKPPTGTAPDPLNDPHCAALKSKCPQLLSSMTK